MIHCRQRARLSGVVRTVLAPTDGDRSRFFATFLLAVLEGTNQECHDPSLTVAFRWRFNPSPKLTSIVLRQFESDLAVYAAQGRRTISR